MGWFMNLMEGSKSDKYDRIEKELESLYRELRYIENINGYHPRGTDREIEDIQNQIDKLELELRCMEAGL